jgi:DNA-binding protein H-NS
MATPTRIYRITIGASDRLVRAPSPASALMHVARDIARVCVASQDDLVECLSDGIKVEAAGEDAQARPAAEAADVVDDKTADLFQAADPGDEEQQDGAPAPQAIPKGPKGSSLRYRDPETGAGWTGRGLKPRWLAEALSSGRELSEFEVQA